MLVSFHVYGDSNCSFCTTFFFFKNSSHNLIKILIGIILLTSLVKFLGQQLTLAIKLIIEYPCHCHKIDFIIFSSFCVFIFCFQIIINIFFHHSKKNANVMTRKKMVFFSRKMRQHRQAYVLELREPWGFLLASFLVDGDSNC